MESPAPNDLPSNPRSREENQERAFVAASRRKDRSLDARLESANRASMLHKKRTGKALNITKEIVENEAMYEEVDERCQEKRLRMLQAQNLRIEEQFQRQLLAAFTSPPQRARARNSASRSYTPFDGVRKMRIDLPLSNWTGSRGPRSAPLEYAPPISNPVGYGPPPTGAASGTTSTGATTMNSFATSTMPLTMPPTPYFSGPTSPYASPAEGWASQAFPPPAWPVPSYVSSTTPPWLAPNTQGMSPQTCHPCGLGSDPQPITMWQQQVLPTPLAPAGPVVTDTSPSRARVGSAPGLLQRMWSTSDPEGDMHGIRAQSEPSHTEVEPPATENRRLPDWELQPGQPSSQETWSTPELCPSPTTCRSSPSRVGMGDDGAPIVTYGDQRRVPVWTEAADPEFHEFSRFAWDLSNSSFLPETTADAALFDDWLTLDRDVGVAN